jgi:hypothetical protein
MALFEGKTPAERNKMIAAVVLPLLAFLFVARMLFFSGGPSSPPTPATNANRQATTTTVGSRGPAAQTAAPPEEANIFDMRPVVWERVTYRGPDAGRNIFAFYIPPTPAPRPSPTEPPPTPAPTPPLLLAGLSPPNVYARTAGFTLQLSGDKFTPASRVYVDGQEQQTQYRSAQQLTASVPAALIAAPGPRTVAVRTPDGVLFSNDATLNVMQPPAPTYTYVGLLKRPRSDTAVLKDQRGELYSVRPGDLVEGRFRVTAIKETGVEVVDKDLNIKHTMPYVQTPGVSGPGGRVPGSIQPPPPPPDEEPKGDAGDDEP